MNKSIMARLIIAAVLIGSCSFDELAPKKDPIKESVDFSRALDELLICAWSNKYSLCICGHGFPYRSGVLIVVPNNRCGHD